MAGLRQDQLASMRDVVQEFLPDVCTNLRTGQTANCRVTSQQTAIRIDGLPRWLPVRRFRVVLPAGFVAKATDQLSVIDGATSVLKGIYLALTEDTPRSNQLQTDIYSILSGPATIASTMRDPQSLARGQVARGQTHLARLTLFPIGDYLFQPVAQQFMADTFGVTKAQCFRVFAQFPPASAWANPELAAEEYPIAGDDTVILPSGAQYTVKALERWEPNFIALYVEIREQS